MRDRFNGIKAAVLVLTLSLAMVFGVSQAFAQKVQVKENNVKAVTSAPVNGGDLKVEKTVSLGLGNYYHLLAPSAVSANAVYSDITSFSGFFTVNGGAASGTKTKMIADDLNLVGTAPYFVTSYRMAIVNDNTTAASVRPTVYFYEPNGAGGNPGSLVVSFLFNPVSVPANSVSIVTGTTPFTLSVSSLWMGVAFDNQGAANATIAQLNKFGLGFYNPVDIGSSTDTSFQTTAGSNENNNPAGARLTFNGSPIANFGLEINSATRVQSINRLDSDPRPSGSMARWLITFNTPVSGLTAANFALVTGGNATATITSVTPNTTAPSTTWTVKATLGSGSGDLELDLVNANNLSTTVTSVLPFQGQNYKVNAAPTAAPAAVEGRVLTAEGTGIFNARVQLTDGNGSSRIVNTNSSGYFRFQEVPTGVVYILDVSHKNYTFAASSQIVYVGSDLQNVNFEALPR